MRVLQGMVVAAAMMGGLASAQAKENGPTLRDRQQAACYNDVQKLCGATIPDVAKTEACMKDKKPLVSEGCAKMWDVKG